MTRKLLIPMMAVFFFMFNSALCYTDPIHFKPKLPTKKAVGDVMPFYWKGEYHIFYLIMM
jgi:hypothetical protein